MESRFDQTWLAYYGVTSLITRKQSQQEQCIKSWLNGYVQVTDATNSNGRMLTFRFSSQKRGINRIANSQLHFNRNILLKMEFVFVDLVEEEHMESVPTEISSTLNKIFNRNRRIDEKQSEKSFSSHLVFLFNHKLSNDIREALEKIIKDGLNNHTCHYTFIEAGISTNYEIDGQIQNELNECLKTAIVSVIFDMESKISLLQAMPMSEVNMLNVPLLYLSNYSDNSSGQKNKKRLAVAHYLKMLGDLCLMFGCYIDAVHLFNSTFKYLRNDDDIVVVGAVYEAIYLSLYYYTCDELVMNIDYSKELEKDKCIDCEFPKLNRSHEEICDTAKNNGYELAKLITKFNVESALTGSIYSYMDFACECYISSAENCILLLLEYMRKYLSLTFKHNLKDKFIYICNKMDAIFVSNNTIKADSDIQIKVLMYLCEYNIRMKMFRRTFFYLNRLFAIFYANRDKINAKTNHKMEGCFDFLLPKFGIYPQFYSNSNSNLYLTHINVSHKYSPVQMKMTFMFGVFMLMNNKWQNYISASITLLKKFSTEITATILTHLNNNFWSRGLNHQRIVIHNFHFLQLKEFNFCKNFVSHKAPVHISKFLSLNNDLFITRCLKNNEDNYDENFFFRNVAAEVGTQVPVELLVTNEFSHKSLLITNIKLIVDENPGESSTSCGESDVTMEMNAIVTLKFAIEIKLPCEITIKGFQYMIEKTQFIYLFPSNETMSIRGIESLTKIEPTEIFQTNLLALEIVPKKISIKNTSNQIIKQIFLNKMDDEHRLIMTHLPKRSLCSAVASNEFCDIDLKLSHSHDFFEEYFKSTSFPITTIITLEFIVFHENQPLYGYYHTVSLSVNVFLELLMDKFVVRKSDVPDKGLCSIRIHNFSNKLTFKVSEMEFGVDNVKNIYIISPKSTLEIDSISIPLLNQQEYLDIIKGDYSNLLTLMVKLFLNNTPILNMTHLAFGIHNDSHVFSNSLLHETKSISISSICSDYQSPNASIQWLAKNTDDFDISHLCKPIALDYEVSIGEHDPINEYSNGSSLKIPLRQLTRFFVKIHNPLDIDLNTTNVSILLNTSKVCILWVGSCFHNFEKISAHGDINFDSNLFPIEKGNHSILFSITTNLEPLVEKYQQGLNHPMSPQSTSTEGGLLKKNRILKELQQYLIVKKDISIEVV